MLDHAPNGSLNTMLKPGPPASSSTQRNDARPCTKRFFKHHAEAWPPSKLEHPEEWRSARAPRISDSLEARAAWPGACARHDKTLRVLIRRSAECLSLARYNR